MIYYILNKINKQIILLTIIAMVIENNPTKKNNMETTNLRDNAKNNNPFKGKKQWQSNIYSSMEHQMQQQEITRSRERSNQKMMGHSIHQ